MAFIYAMTDAWNNNATNFTAIQMTITDTTSGASSLLMDLYAGNTGRLRINKWAAILFNNQTGGTANIFSDASGASSLHFNGNSPNAANCTMSLNGTYNTLTLTSFYAFGFGTNPGQQDSDVKLVRVEAGMMKLTASVTTSYAHIAMFTNRTVGVTFASLPGVASVSVGGRAMITDGAGAVFNVTAAGGGANVVPVFSDGTQWKVG